jgi:hypothetical protein
MAATPFQTEAWTEYGIGVLILLLRYYARWKVVGFRGWQGDDWFAVLALVFWTVGHPTSGTLTSWSPANTIRVACRRSCVCWS